MTESQTDVRKWVTAVILMEDDAEGTEECVRSLLRGSCVPGILLIDDSAGRLPEEQLRERYPGITIFRTGFQTGRCHAANCGLHLVRTPYALLLSGSVRAGRSMTQHLLDAAVSEDRCYAAQARIERLEEKGRIESTGVLFSAAGRAVYRDRGMYRKTSRGGEVFAPDMRAVLLNMRAMEDLGLFDERLTGIGAEADLGCRAARVDGRCLFVPKARAGIRAAAADAEEHAADPRAEAEGTYVLDKNMPSLLQILGTPFRAAGAQHLSRHFARERRAGAWQEAVERSRSLCEIRVREDLLREAGASVTKQPLPEEMLIRPRDPECEGVYPLYVGSGMRTETGDLPSVLRLSWQLLRNVPRTLRPVTARQ